MSRVKFIKEPGKFFEPVYYSEFSQQELEEMSEKVDPPRPLLGPQIGFHRLEC